MRNMRGQFLSPVLSPPFSVYSYDEILRDLFLSSYLYDGNSVSSFHQND